MKLHENKEQFENAILAASQSLNIQEIYIEKDYWVTVALYLIFHSEMANEAVFKGGTALSKCHKIIERFSEDIDIVVLRKNDENDNQLKKKIRKIGKIVEAIIPEINDETLTNKKGNIRKTVHQYQQIYKGNFAQVRKHIVLEATWLGNYEPYTNETVSCYIADMMENNGQNDLIEKYNLQPFKVQVLGKERTFCEKIMSLVRFSRQGDPYIDLANKIRHIYDLHMLLKNAEIYEFFGSSNFDQMLVKVGQDDKISYINKNEWLNEHPSEAIIFKSPEKTWSNIKSPYQTTFKELVTGDFPAEIDLINTLKKIANRLQKVEWNI
ncbi:MAG: nucleotidyl transferase AbiEii/AbiGii toxin family protein [Bacteroidales bacterium]